MASLSPFLSLFLFLFLFLSLSLSVFFFFFLSFFLVPGGQEIAVTDAASGAVTYVAYDKLVLATGAKAIKPDIPGINLPGEPSVNEFLTELKKK
jgi:hypothetical protein